MNSTLKNHVTGARDAMLLKFAQPSRMLRSAPPRAMGMPHRIAGTKVTAGDAETRSALDIVPRRQAHNVLLAVYTPQSLSSANLLVGSNALAIRRRLLATNAAPKFDRID